MRRSVVFFLARTREPRRPQRVDAAANRELPERVRRHIFSPNRRRRCAQAQQRRLSAPARYRAAREPVHRAQSTAAYAHFRHTSAGCGLGKHMHACDFGGVDDDDDETLLFPAP